MSNLRCPYCDGRLEIETEWRGHAWGSEQVPESIQCYGPPDGYGCGAEWETDGTLRTAGPCACGDPRCDGKGQYR